MAEGRKPVLETHRVAFNVLSTHLKEFRRRSRRKSPLPPPSEKEIREEVRRILEIFLKKQVENNNEEQTAIPTSFQKVVVEDVIKTEGPGSTRTSREGSRYSSKTSCAKCRSEASQSIPGGSIQSLTDDTIDFPFIDDIDVDDNGDELRNRKWPVPLGWDDIDVDDNGEWLSDRGRTVRWPAGARGPQRLKSGTPTGARGPQRLKSGTESSDDTDYEEEFTKISEKEDIPIEPIYASDEDSEVQEMSRDEVSDRGSLLGPTGARGPQRLKSGTESSDDTDYEEELTKTTKILKLLKLQEMPRDEVSDREWPVPRAGGATETEVWD